jgi:nicotinamidase-related amidase
MAEALLPIPLTDRTVHLCLDMQRLFAEDGPWPTPWMHRVLPVVEEIVGRFPERTIFTRFITPENPDEMPGLWQRYYVKWRQTTREHLPREMLNLLPELACFVPPAVVLDKSRYSAFSSPELLPLLRKRGVDGLIVTGSETDVCVLSTVMSAVDLGYRVILVRDAVCSSSDAGHDALLSLYHRRYSEQVETADAQDVLSHWR